MAETTLTWSEVMALSPKARAAAYDAASDHQKALWREERYWAEESRRAPGPRLLAEEFEPYARALVEVDPSADLDLARRVFFAGAKAVLHLIFERAEQSEATGDAYLRFIASAEDDLRAETRGFSWRELLAEDPELVARTEARTRAKLAGEA